jgi:CheY-like chemotaxis protein
MKPLRIAIAEDNWFIAEYVCSELAALGHAIVGRARTGEELIDLVAHERPDLVLVDVRLADGSDGLAAAKEIQERFEIPAIAATGHLTAAEGEAAGLLGIRSKPYTSHALRAGLDGAAAWLESGSSRPFLKTPILAHRPIRHVRAAPGSTCPEAAWRVTRAPMQSSARGGAASSPTRC